MPVAGCEGTEASFSLFLAVFTVAARCPAMLPVEGRRHVGPTAGMDTLLWLWN